MRLCFSVTEAEVERAKNVFKTSLFMHLDGQLSRTTSSTTSSSGRGPYPTPMRVSLEIATCVPDAFSHCVMRGIESGRNFS